jgi:hypothetical protein
MKVDEYAERAAEELLMRTRPDATQRLGDLLRLRRRRLVERAVVAIAVVAVAAGGLAAWGARPDRTPDPSGQQHGVRNGALIGRPLGGAGVVVTGGDLPFVPDAARYTSISFTRDGRTLVYSDARGNAVALDETTGRTRQLYRCRSESCDARISPDGKRLVVERTQGAVVVRLDVPSAEPVSLDGMFASWSPDSHRLAMNTRQGVTIVDVDGGTPELAFPHPSGGPVSWSPDGREIAVIVMKVDRGRSEALGATVYQHQLVVVDTVDKTVRKLADVGACACFGVAPPSVAWSPDGRLIAFTRIKSGPPRDPGSAVALGAWTIRPDGTALAPVDSVHVMNGQLSWRPIR